MNDYKELIAHVQGDAAFRHIISECGADGRVWFDKRFICDYVSHLKYAIEQLVADNESYKCAFADLRNEIANYCETIATLEKERDAAVADLKEFCDCGACVSAHDMCDTCLFGSKWEWRGVKEDNDEIG